jgi:probable HAF family extracellular repeat protein
VGFSSSANATTGNYEAFRWTQQTGMVGLGDLPGGTFNSTADGISADGSIIVGTSTTGLGDEAFIWDSGNGMRNLRDVLVNDYGLGAALTGWQLIGAVISADGHTFAGSGINPDGNTEAWVATVPEPSSLTLAVVMGAFAVFCCFRNRKSRLSRVD